MTGTLMSGLDIRPNKRNKDMLIYPGAYHKYNDVKRKAIKHRTKNGKLPGLNFMDHSLDSEILRYINSSDKTQALKDELSYNKERKKTRDVPKSIGAMATGAGLGAALPLGVGAALNATGVEKGKRLSEAVKGAKAMVSDLGMATSPAERFASKTILPAMGAGLGLAAGGYAAHKLNEAKRNKLIGPKKTEVHNEMSYDLDNHMRSEDAIRRIADNATVKGMADNMSMYKGKLKNKQAFEIVDTSFDKIAGFPIEKEAGLKRDMRIARAEAKANTPRLIGSRTNIDEYKKQMAGYADSVESFLNSKDKKQDWKTKMEMAKLNQSRGFSSRNKGDISGIDDVKSFVEARIADKHNKGIVKNRESNYRIADNIKGLDEYKFNDIRSHKLESPKSKFTIIADDDGLLSKKYKAQNNNLNITLKDDNLKKQLTSGQHKQNLIDPKDLYDGKTYFKTHSSESPFDIGGRHLKRELNGTPTMTKNGVPIWASKLPEVSSEYGNTMVGFTPNKNMIDGASVIDHPHLARDTRRMGEKRIKRQQVYNKFFKPNHNPEYERVFTYNKKDMDNSITSTYKRVGAGSGKVHGDEYKMVKNKPGSLADRFARDIVNGPQMDFIDDKTLKKLDRAHLKRSTRGLIALDKGVQFQRKEHLRNAVESMPSKMREVAKNEGLRTNVLFGLGGAAAATGLGALAYRDIKRAKEKRDFLKKKKEQENN